jgi:hypothetical protein
MALSTSMEETFFVFPLKMGVSLIDLETSITTDSLWGTTKHHLDIITCSIGSSTAY